MQTTLQQSVEETRLNYIAGYFDGNGKILANIQKRKKNKFNFRFEPKVRINKANKERQGPAMGLVDEYCEENNVTYGIRDTTTFYQQLVIQDAKSIRRFLEPLQERLIVNYEDSLIMTKQFLPAFTDNMAESKRGFYELAGIADELRSENRAKYTQEYFADKWEDDLDLE